MYDVLLFESPEKDVEFFEFVVNDVAFFPNDVYIGTATEDEYVSDSNNPIGYPIEVVVPLTLLFSAEYPVVFFARGL